MLLKATNVPYLSRTAILLRDVIGLASTSMLKTPIISPGRNILRAGERSLVTDTNDETNIDMRCNVRHDIVNITFLRKTVFVFRRGLEGQRCIGNKGGMTWAFLRPSELSASVPMEGLDISGREEGVGIIPINEPKS